MRPRYINAYNAEIALLIMFIVYGLIGKLLISLNRSLDSDSVIAGIVSREIWVHKNLLLSQFYLPSSTPHIFSDILPFHLLPQIISNFDPSAIRIMSFVIFLLVIGVFSYLIFKIAGNIINGLIFAALFSNLWAGSFSFYSMPTSHNGTLFFTGIFLLLLLYRNLELNLISILSILLLNLIVFSDSIIIVWFVVPFVFTYILFIKDKNSNSNLMMLLIFLTTLLTYVIKTFFISSFVMDEYYIKDVRTIFEVNIPLYIEGLLHLLNNSLYSIYDTLNLSDYLIIFSFALLSYYSITYMLSDLDIQTKKLNYIFIISAIVTFLVYVSTSICMGLGTSRYLTLTALSIYVLISLSYNKKNIYMILIFLILFSSVFSNNALLKNLDFQPNKPQLELIQYLKDDGLQFGVGDYWNSNIITYLSKEQVIIRPIKPYNGQLWAHAWYSSERWFSEFSELMKSRFFIISSANDAMSKDELDRYLAYNPPAENKTYGDYKIFEYNQGT